MWVPALRSFHSLRPGHEAVTRVPGERKRDPGPRKRTNRALHRAGVLLLGRIDAFERLVGGGDRRPERQEIVLVLGLPFGLHGERIGLLDELVIPRTEVGL